MTPPIVLTKTRSDFYRMFQERYYAPFHVIKDLRKQYLPFIKPLISLYPGGTTFDIGCGRGEWLELMTELGMKPLGVDLDAGMLQDCHERHLSAHQGDAVSYLTKLPSESQVVISAFHVVEHLAFDQIDTIVSEAHRVLKPGGLLLIETPNPENILVGAHSFYLDPTHQRPLPPQLLSFLADFYRFIRVKILRLQESPHLACRDNMNLRDVLGGVSPDYAIVAQKTADADILQLFDAPFEKDYGVELYELASSYDAGIKHRIALLDQRIANLESNTGGLNDALLARIAQLQDMLISASTQIEREKARGFWLAEQLSDRESAILEENARAAAAEAQAAAQAQIAKLAEARADVQAQRADTAEAQIPLLNAKADELQGRLHEWWLKACDLEAERDALHQSWSWRITVPARWALAIAPFGSSAAGRAAAKLSRSWKGIFEHLLLAMMRQVLAHPSISERVNRRLLRYPKLHDRLLSVAQRGGLMPSVAIDTASCPESLLQASTGHQVADVDRLSKRAQTIFQDLQSAVMREPEGNR